MVINIVVHPQLALLLLVLNSESSENDWISGKFIVQYVAECLQLHIILLVFNIICNLHVCCLQDK